MLQQKAEEVPGVVFHGRKVYLEQRGANGTEIAADLPAVRRDCVEFSITMKKLVELHKNTSGSTGLITNPHAFGKFMNN